MNNQETNGQLEARPQRPLDFETIVLRRSDPDDQAQITELVDIAKQEFYAKTFAYARVLRLIETSYLSITVLAEDGSVVGFAAFHDSPQGMKGLYDDLHFNAWEKWFHKACEVSQFNAQNTLWMVYFVAAPWVAPNQVKTLLSRIFQTVYTSVPEVNGILFIQRGDVDPDDLQSFFAPIESVFEEIPLQHPNELRSVRGIHPSSRIYFSSRLNTLPFVKIRRAAQQDHDDLAAVFNSQSEAVTESYGQYYLAELIAAQNAQNKALAAQVEDKAVGLMAVTSEVDLKLLHQCFGLSPFDNLLKPDFMDALNARRREILEERKRQAEEERLQQLQRLKRETMLCNLISQRVALQEFLLKKTQDIETKITFYDNNKQKQNLTAQLVEEMLDQLLDGFQIRQPSQYFLDHPTDDIQLFCNVLTAKQFLLKTLEIFGLPDQYMKGKGHFADWEKRQAEAKARNKPLSIATRLRQRKQAKKFPGKDSKRKGQIEERPSYFDLEPFKNAVKAFLLMKPQVRSQMRTLYSQQMEKIQNEVFVDAEEDNEATFKRVVDLKKIGAVFKDKKISKAFGGNEAESGDIEKNIGQMLLCFGDIQFIEELDIKETKRDIPKEAPQPPADAKRDRASTKKREGSIGKDDVIPEEPVAGGKEEEKKEEKKEERKEEKKEKETVLEVYKKWSTSIHDFIEAVEKMADYDYTLHEMGLLAVDLTEEKAKAAMKGKGRGQAALSDQDSEKGEGEDGPAGAGVRSATSGSRPRSKQTAASQQVIERMYQYSADPEYEQIMAQVQDIDSIPLPPERAKNAIAVTLFCIEAAFESRSRDFLEAAFQLFPERDYLIVTQPHTVGENALLTSFTQCEKRPENTFSHVLYVCHRDSLLASEMRVGLAQEKEMQDVIRFLETQDSQKEKSEIQDAFYDATVNPESKNASFVARVGDDIVGAFVLAREVNLRYYVSHFNVQDLMILNEHGPREHTRLLHSVLNPIFQRSTRYILKQLMRLFNKTSIYFETDSFTTIPTIFNELIPVRSRRFPHFLKRKWDNEHFEAPATQEEEEAKAMMDGADRHYLDEQEAPFALSFITKRNISEPKIVKNSRIVVVGASDAGLSFIEALLSLSYLHFTNITLIAPGGLPHHHATDTKSNLKAYSTSYTNDELARLMLETRVRVINARMVDINRADKHIILQDERMVPYDTLVLTMGLQDKTLQCLGYVSRGIAPVPNGLDRIEGLISLDDPYLYQHLRADGSLLPMLVAKKKPQKVVVYGRSINTFAAVQGLMNQGVPGNRISLVIPDLASHVMEGYDSVEEMQNEADVIYPAAFEDELVESKVLASLETLGVTIYRNAVVMELLSDNEQTKLLGVKIKLLDFVKQGAGEQAQSEMEMEGESYMAGYMMNKSGDHSSDQKTEQTQEVDESEVTLDCRVLLTAGHRDVDLDVFNAIHNNGLVYNGRLIVDRNFQTTDPSIFAAGSLCEFSGRYKSLSQGRALRLDRYNGREIGSHLARAVFDIQDPTLAGGEQSSVYEEQLPIFYLPQGVRAVIGHGLVYYHIKSTNPLTLRQSEAETRNRKELLSDNLQMQPEGGAKGHLVKFSFNSIGVVDEVSYLGSQDLVLQSLWSFVGLHENYLNNLVSRYPKGIIPNVSEFLSENWAIALYHEWFADFCLRVRQTLQADDSVRGLLAEAGKLAAQNKGLTREDIAGLEARVEKAARKNVEEMTLEFIKANMNHLPMYYVPGEEFK